MSTPAIEVVGLRVTYRSSDRRGRRTSRGTTETVAVDGVDLRLSEGQILGVVGESGSGKTTVARCVAGFLAPTAGEVLIEGVPAAGKRDRRSRRRVQMIFQDPYSSLDPSMTLARAIREPIAVHRLRPRSEIDSRVAELLTLVGLDEDLGHAKPRQLSGGQRQRASIARALAVEPGILVADEPVSALDVSVQAVILNLLADLRQRFGMSMLFISHDMSVVAHLCDEVAVMKSGRVVESGPTGEVFTAPQHPYTQQLLAAVPPHPWGTGGPARDFRVSR